MTWSPQQLLDAADAVKQGKIPIFTVRQLLSWFQAYRRSWRNVAMIRTALQEQGLETEPDFESPHIDALIAFRSKQDPAPPSASDGTAVGLSAAELAAYDREIALTVGATGHEAPMASVVQSAEPAHQISRLKSANTPPVWVKPDASVAEAITIMIANDFSQLPVMQSDREPKGLFTWKSLGSRIALGCECEIVRECMDGYKEIEPDASLYDAIPLIVQHDCVLIRDGARKITGIVTPADLSIQFQDLAEPFLLLGVIENQLRAWIASRFSKDDLRAAKNPEDKDRQIDDVSDLTFGEYLRLLENQENWEKLQTKIDRKVFIEKLDRIRNIRNDIMHFDPDPMEPAELTALRGFSRFLERLRKLGPNW